MVLDDTSANSWTTSHPLASAEMRLVTAVAWQLPSKPVWRLFNNLPNFLAQYSIPSSCGGEQLKKSAAAVFGRDHVRDAPATCATPKETLQRQCDTLGALVGRNASMKTQ
jgi:hypothetical protein